MKATSLPLVRKYSHIILGKQIKASRNLINIIMGEKRKRDLIH